MSDIEEDPEVLNEASEDIDDNDIGLIEECDDNDIISNQDSDSEIDLDSEDNLNQDNEDNLNQDNLEKNKSSNNIPINLIGGSDENEDDDINYDSNLEKITHKDQFLRFHPETKHHNFDEIINAAVVTRNSDNIIIDKLHTTIPLLSKYEYTKIIGQRTKQLNEGAEPFVFIDKEIIDNSLIAEEELKQKKIPFIIQRPLPNGAFEYWHLKDLELL